MDCAVCGRFMPYNIRRSFEPGQEYCEEHYECGCGYEEFITSYGVHTVTIEGIEYPCGDSTTIEGNLQAWRIWFAVLAAREALNDEV